MPDSASPQQSRLAQRYRREKRFRWYGRLALLLAAGVLALLLGSVVDKARHALWVTEIQLEVYFDPAVLDPDDTGDVTAMRRANYARLLRYALQKEFPEVTERQPVRALLGLMSEGAQDQLREMVQADISVVGSRQTLWLMASDEVDMLAKGRLEAEGAGAHLLTEAQQGWLATLEQKGQVRQSFNSLFFLHGDSREPELAGMLGAIAGSLLTMLVCLVAAFPLAVMTAVYLEEFAPRNRMTHFIEININNLAAVPSIIFGLLGLALYLQLFGMPRSSALAGGLTLALMILPVIIISTRASLRSVPGSIRDAARGLGASPLQVVLHHVLPLAMPGIMTGTILGVARAIGETAPLLLIGMVAFAADIPGGVTDPATVMPVQVYLWADSPELSFVSRTSLCILVLLGFMVLMNATAIWIRSKFERRW